MCRCTRSFIPEDVSDLYSASAPSGSGISRTIPYRHTDGFRTAKQRFRERVCTETYYSLAARRTEHSRGITPERQDREGVSLERAWIEFELGMLGIQKHKETGAQRLLGSKVPLSGTGILSICRESSCHASDGQ